MENRIDQAALDAAAAGANPPPADRLRAAAEYVMNRTKPGQLILFGSAVRGEFGNRSDFDFLVVRPKTADRRTVERPSRWEHPETGDEIDVLFADADLLERHRWAAGTVYCSVLAEGATVFVATAGGAVKTLRDAGEKAEDMAKQGKYEPHQAAEFARDARLHLSYADIAEAEAAWGPACKQLQESAERSLKALIITKGSPFSYIHDLGGIWDEAEKLGETVAAARDDRVLRAVSTYSGRAGYGSQYQGNAEELYKEFRPTAENLLNNAQARVPALLAEHERKRGGTGPKPDDEAPAQLP